MKKFHQKSLVLLAALVLLLTCTVSGTVAYLTADSGPVTNTFTPVQVDTIIEETFTKENGKTSIKILNKNDPKNIPVYVRVAVYGNWVDASGKIVAPWSGLSSYNTSNWTQKTDGYYYYNGELAVGATTEDLLTQPIVETNKPEGADHLEVVVVHQAIQTEPADAAQEAWDWTPPASAQ